MNTHQLYTLENSYEVEYIVKVGSKISALYPLKIFMKLLFLVQIIILDYTKMIFLKCRHTGSKSLNTRFLLVRDYKKYK